MQYDAYRVGASNIYVLTATGKLGAQISFFVSSLIWLHIYYVKYYFSSLLRDVSDNKWAANSAQNDSMSFI